MEKNPKFNSPLASAGRIPELDGIRGVAILLVLVHHYVGIQIHLSPKYWWLASVLGITWTGVDLFFVLSGFLIGGILLDNCHLPGYFRVFYIRRICRIFPLYFFWLLLFLLLSALVSHTGSAFYSCLFAHPLPLWSYVTFTQNILMSLQQTWGAKWLDITWSLAVEEQFYLVLPLLIFVIPRRYLPLVLLGAIATAPIARNYISSDCPLWWPRSKYVLMPCRMDSLLLGVSCAFILRQKDLVRWLTKNIWVVYGILLFCGLQIARYMRLGGSVDPVAIPSVEYTIFSVLYSSILLVTVLHKRGPVAMLARITFLRFTGTLVSCQPSTFGYNLFSFLLASSVVNCQSTFAWT